MCKCGGTPNPNQRCVCENQQAKLEQQRVPHKHAALIKAWAECPETQFQFRGASCQVNTWYNMSKTQPDWSHSEIRIKPGPRPDVVVKRTYHVRGDSMTRDLVAKPNVQFTFDGETGELKSVCLV